MTRRSAATVLILVAAALLSACGSAGRSSVTTVKSATSTTGTTPTGGAAALAKRRALAFSAAVNLTSRDVPGFRAEPVEHESKTAGEKQLGREMLRCAEDPGGQGTGIAEADSEVFQSDRFGRLQTVHSAVAVAHSAAIAMRELTVIQTPRARACVSHYIGLFLNGHLHPGETIGPISIASGTPPAPGVTGSFAWRVRMTLAAGPAQLRLYLDALGFIDGPAKATLLAAGIETPFPAATEERLFSLLLARAKAHAA